MKGEYDDLLEWPFPLKYKLFIVDQQPNLTAADITDMVDPILNGFILMLKEY